MNPDWLPTSCRGLLYVTANSLYVSRYLVRAWTVTVVHLINDANVQDVGRDYEAQRIS